jgi:hypothetical protein
MVIERSSHGHRIVVSAVIAAGDYVHEKTPLRSVFPLTSIAPTSLDVHIHLIRPVVATKHRLAQSDFSNTAFVTRFGRNSLRNAQNNLSNCDLTPRKFVRMF